jgi:pleiotropic regulator 1
MADIASGAVEQNIPQDIAQNARLAVQRSAKRTREIFAADFGQLSALDTPPQPSVAPSEPSPADRAQQASVAARIRNEYADVKELPAALAQKQANAQAGLAARRKKAKTEEQASDPKMVRMIEAANSSQPHANGSSSTALTRINGTAGAKAPPNANGPTPQRDTPATNLVRRDTVRHQKPQWHAPWKLMRVISGHLGWVRALAVEPGNEWFASGAGDRTIKIWDMAKGTLKVTLTGHISTVRGLAVSPRHPYLFSCGEDKMVKCWDLETNKVIRHYHGHLSGVYTLSLHPTLDVLCTGGRDGVVRVWDMRTRSNVHVLSGHKGTVSSIQTQATDPQIMSSSLDSTIRMYDLAAGKTMGVLTSQEGRSRSHSPPYRIHIRLGITRTNQAMALPARRFHAKLRGPQQRDQHSLSQPRERALLRWRQRQRCILGLEDRAQIPIRRLDRSARFAGCGSRRHGIDIRSDWNEIDYWRGGQDHQGLERGRECY